MPTLSDREIASYVAISWRGAGDKEATALRTAIVLAESGGRTDVRNACCTGLAQIHYVHAGGPEGSPSGREEFRKWLENPQNNMRAARYVEDRQGLSAWEVYTNGRYRQFLSRAAEAADVSAGRAGPGGDLSPGEMISDIASAATDPAQAIGALTDVMQNIGDVFGNVFSWISDPDTWKRIALAVGGLAVAGMGAAIIARPVIAPAARTASQAIPAGKMAKAVRKVR